MCSVPGWHKAQVAETGTRVNRTMLVGANAKARMQNTRMNKPVAHRRRACNGRMAASQQRVRHAAGKRRGWRRQLVGRAAVPTSAVCACARGMASAPSVSSQGVRGPVVHEGQ